MVPGSGTESNSRSPLISAWDDISQPLSEELEQPLTIETYGDLFDSLAAINDYVEQHVPECKELLL